MELSKGTREVIVQAQMLRLSAKQSDTLCVEHLLYGLLLLARYLDPPLNKEEYRAEAEALRGEMAKTMRSVESAVYQLKKDAPDPDNGFADASAAIGRASELAEKRGSDEIDALCLWTAVLESQTPTVLALRGLSIPACAVEDAKYEASKQQEQQEPAASEEDSGLTASQLGVLLALLAAAGENEREELKSSAHKIPVRGNKIKRRTKMGLFTYRGGTASAAIQYFLYGLIVPFALLCGLETLWGLVTVPPSPFVGFLVNAFIVLWMFYLARGAAKLLGLMSNAFGNFLEILIGCAFIMGLAESARMAYDLPHMPVWLRVLVCVCSLITVLVGIALYKHLRDQGDKTKTKILFQNVEGTPGMAFFRYLTKALILPLIIASVIWIFDIKPAPWMIKALWILGFLWVWNILLAMWNCLSQRLENSRRRRRGKRLVKFLGAQHVLLGIPALVLFLHWLFGWFPMRTWVIVVLCAYGLYWLIASITTIAAIKD